jgi:thiamine monophosphate kinase
MRCLRRLRGGDDYELLFAVSPKRRGRLRGVFREARGVPITKIGALTADRSIGLTRNGGSSRCRPGSSTFNWA